VPSMPRTEGSESGLWPTPASRDWKDGRSNQHGRNARPLNEVVRLFPTPDAYMGQRGGAQTAEKRKNGGHKVNLEDVCGGRKLNPEFVEYLMGFPIGHTACEGWATPSSRKSHTKSCGASEPSSAKPEV
jgi:hypothetical protein